MKIIAILSMLAVSLVVALDLIPKGSVGGAMTFALLFILASLIVGIYEAWGNGRGVLGWIVSIIVAGIGGMIGAAAGALVLETVLTLLAPEGSLMQIGGPLLYLSVNAQMLFTLLGAWLGLGIVNKFRDKSVKASGVTGQW